MYVELEKGLIKLYSSGYAKKEDVSVDIILKDNIVSSRYLVKLNSLPRFPVVKPKFIIPKDLFEKQVLNIEILVEDSSQRTSKSYQSNPIPIASAVILGEVVEDAYPITIQTLRDEIKTYTKHILDLELALKELDKRVEELEDGGNLL